MSFPGVDIKVTLSNQLDKIVTSLAPENLEDTLSTLKKIFDNIIQHSNDDKYRQIKLANKTFSSKVWRYPACEELMKMSGWVVEDDYVRLKDDSHVHIVSQLLEEACRQDNFFPPEEVRIKLNFAIYYGAGFDLKLAIEQYNASEIKRMYVNGGLHILSAAYQARQIGIVQILVSDYKIDANRLKPDGLPCFFELFTGCDSSDACQSLIIQFIKEFKLHVGIEIKGYLSVIHLAVLNKLLKVVRFLVQECSIDVNKEMRFDMCGNTCCTTPLHLAYGTNQSETAQYLIKCGANQSAIDADGKKPLHYLPNSGENRYSRLSEYFVKRRKLFNKYISDERVHFENLCNTGISEEKAIYLTYQEFPKLNEALDLDTIPTMNKLNHYITDMALSYYDIGLALDIPNSELSIIQGDSNLADIRVKCRKMLDVWLKTDSSASWRKLCNALEHPSVTLCPIAEKIKKSDS